MFILTLYINLSLSLSLSPSLSLSLSLSLSHCHHCMEHPYKNDCQISSSALCQVWLCVDAFLYFEEECCFPFIELAHLIVSMQLIQEHFFVIRIQRSHQVLQLISHPNGVPEVKCIPWWSQRSDP